MQRNEGEDMIGKEAYTYILDGSNILHDNDHPKTIDGKEVALIDVDRLKLAVQTLRGEGHNVLVCVDISTTKKAPTYYKPSKNQFNKCIKLFNAHKISNDSEIIQLKRENPNSIIITNDAFPGWINGDESVDELTAADWQKEKEERKKYQIHNGRFTLLNNNLNSPSKKKLLKKQKSKLNVDQEVLRKTKNHDRISSNLQSLGARTENLTSKIDSLSSHIEGLLSSITRSNSSALIPCKYEDEFGKSHLCFIGKNLHILQDGKWIEIALGENIRLLA